MKAKRYLNEQEVAEITGRGLSSLRGDRWRCRGFPYIKIGRRVFYDEDDIHKVMAMNKIEPRKK